MKKFHLIVTDSQKINTSPQIISFDYDETVVSNPKAVIEMVVSDFLQSEDAKEFIDNDFCWNDAVFCVPTELYLNHGLTPTDYTSVGVIVDSDVVLNKTNKTAKCPASAPVETRQGSNVVLYTDGACMGNPGPGGWGAILCCDGKETELSGFEKNSTNNRMEISAALGGLEALKEPSTVTVISDSKYLVDSVEKGWLNNWQRNGWINSSGNDTPNVDLWKRLLIQLLRHKVIFTWVKGHNGHPYNERCDNIAVRQCSGRV